MTLSTAELADLARRIRGWAHELGFQQAGIAAPDLAAAGARLHAWLDQGHHADMEWLRSRAALSTSPATTVPGTIRVISVRMDYSRADAWPGARLAAEPDRGWIARYALGRDYHRIMRPRLQRLATRVTEAIGPFGYRAFVDSGPVMEKPLAQQAGLGWIGKHSNLVNTGAGSWFLLGELLTDLALPVDMPAENHCGSCTACLAACPTGAIVAPYVVDARRCISYLTIENKGPIPQALRASLGNRIFGCDDCQLACPWNKFAQSSAEADFAPRHGLDRPSLAEMFLWSEATWLERTAGSAIRRAGFTGWLRNLAVALGNAPTTPQVLAALETHRDHPAELVREHVRWALQQHGRD